MPPVGSGEELERTPPPVLAPIRATSGLIEGAMLGPYRMEELLGEGSGGRVYRAVHTRLDRQVAVKVLRSEHAHKQHLVRRFFQEARAANQIQHENIVAITDLVTEENARCYIIMELLRGESLEQVLARDRFVPLERALRIARQVCSAMDAAHSAGIIHRDLKPGNVFLTERGDDRDFVKLLDFGVAKIPFFSAAEGVEGDSPGTDPGRTQQGALLGTPEYMSPEQTEGKTVDHRADIYSLGVMLYEMVTGRRPFYAPTLQGTLENQRSHNPPSPAALPDLPHRIPARLESLIVRCLAKTPEDRPNAMREVLVELSAVREELDRNSRPSRAPALLMLLSIGAAIAIAGGYLVIRDLPGREALIPQAATPVAGTIQLTFESIPPGAEVIRSATGRSLGTTPVSVRLPRTSETERFEVKKRGFLPYEHLVTLSADDTLSAELSRAVAPRARRRY